jgi:hypothetical protein
MSHYIDLGAACSVLRSAVKLNEMDLQDRRHKLLQLASKYANPRSTETLEASQHKHRIRFTIY